MIDLPLDYKEVIWMLFIAIAIVQFFFHWIIFGRLAIYKPKIKEMEDYPPVSVIICAKNEYTNLRHFLPSVLEQDYANFEVIVVNDDSTDDTEFLIKTLQLEYPQLKLVNISNSIRFFKGKKFPLSVGIKSAKHELVLLTDADCKAATNQWIKRMVTEISNTKQIVLGYGGYLEKKELMNYVVRYESLRIAMQYMSFALWKMPYMGVGRNLAYKKSLFFDNKGFTSHYDIESGDDDLFIKEVANSKNTTIMVQSVAKTLSNPKPNLSSWYFQKKRHFSTSGRYKFKHQFLLSLWDLSTFLIYPVFLLLILLKFNVLISTIILAFRIVSHILITKKMMILFGEKKILLISLLIEWLLVIAYPAIIVSNFVVGKNRWK